MRRARAECCCGAVLLGSGRGVFLPRRLLRLRFLRQVPLTVDAIPLTATHYWPATVTAALSWFGDKIGAMELARCVRRYMTSSVLWHGVVTKM
jgi:hypothetical protein